MGWERGYSKKQKNYFKGMLRKGKERKGGGKRATKYKASRKWAKIKGKEKRKIVLLTAHACNCPGFARTISGEGGGAFG